MLYRSSIDGMSVVGVERFGGVSLVDHCERKTVIVEVRTS